MDRYIDYRQRTDFTSNDSVQKSRESDYLYSKDSSDRLALTRVPGILQLSSNAVGACAKRGYVKKRFRSLISELPELMVPTNNRKRVDQLVLVDIQLQNSSDIRKKQMVLNGTIAEYIGDADSSLNSSKMSRLATGHWKRKNDRNYESSISSIDLMESERIDYLEPFTISIDPDDCQDVDDAISIRTLDSEDELMYEVGIHIADPTSYIIEGSDLDLEGLRRSESVYLQDTIHMYPTELTTDVFSLSSSRVSRAFSVLFDIKMESGEITNIRILKTRIKVDLNESYDGFDRTYVDPNEKTRLCKTRLYKSALYDVGKLIYRSFISDSVLDYDSKKMVQAYMVYANSVVADFLIRGARSGIVCRPILRSQPRVDTTLDIDITDTPSEILDTHFRLRWRSAILKIWSDDSTDSHFGVGLKLYTHFTSPIRRYSDILVHRQLWNTLMNKRVFALDSLNDDSYLQTLFTLNHNKRFYRQMVNFERDWKIYDEVKSLSTEMDIDDPINLRGDIVEVNGLFIKVMITGLIDQRFDRLFTKYFNRMVIRVDVMSRKMMESIEASNDTPFSLETDSNGVITSVNTFDNRRYSLFDSVDICLVFIKGVRRYRAYLS